jgi:hypothetical protein
MKFGEVIRSPQSNFVMTGVIAAFAGGTDFRVRYQ